jgi:hypothetical protein
MRPARGAKAVEFKAIDLLRSDVNANPESAAARGRWGVGVVGFVSRLSAGFKNAGIEFSETPLFVRPLGEMGLFCHFAFCQSTRWFGMGMGSFFRVRLFSSPSWPAFLEAQLAKGSRVLILPELKQGVCVASGLLCNFIGGFGIPMSSSAQSFCLFDLAEWVCFAFTKGHAADPRNRNGFVFSSPFFSSHPGPLSWRPT